MKHPLRLSLVVLALTLPGTLACHDNDGKIGPESASVDVVVRDAPVDDLLTFRAEMVGVRLRDEHGNDTENLLSAPATIDLLGLRDMFGWFSSERVANGVYQAVVLDFSPSGYEAVDMLGFPVAVFPLADRLVAPLLGPVEITGSYRRFEIDVDLRDSIIGSVGLGLIGFRPRGSGVGQNGAQPTRMDEINGIVQSVDASDQRLVMDAFVDGDMRVALGRVEVHFGAGTTFVQQSGNLFSSAGTFAASLMPGVTQIEAIGSAIQRGVLRAELLAVEDLAGTGSATAVELEGDVVTRFADGVFELRIRRVRKGEELFDAALGERTFVLVYLDVTTTVLQESAGEFEALPSAGTADLAAGQRVKVKLPDLSFEPFFATELQIRSPLAEFPGELTRATGQSTHLEARIAFDAAAVLAGEISPFDPVELNVARAEIVLGTLGSPRLTFHDVVPGLDVTIFGVRTGPPDAATIDPARVSVRAGSLVDADVVTADRAGSTFRAEGGIVVESFGSALQPGAIDVTLEPDAVFLGDARSEEELFDLFDGLGPGQQLSVRVDGLSDRTASGVRGYEIEATVLGSL